METESTTGERVIDTQETTGKMNGSILRNQILTCVADSELRTGVESLKRPEETSTRASSNEVFPTARESSFTAAETEG